MEHTLDTYVQLWRQPASNVIDGDIIAHSVYLRTTIATISVAPPQPQEEDIKFLDTIEGAQDNIWEIKVLVEYKLIIFKVDTGAEVTVISEKAWKSLQSDKP